MSRKRVKETVEGVGGADDRCDSANHPADADGASDDPTERGHGVYAEMGIDLTSTRTDES